MSSLHNCRPGQRRSAENPYCWKQGETNNTNKRRSPMMAPPFRRRIFGNWSVVEKVSAGKKERDRTKGRDQVRARRARVEEDPLLWPATPRRDHRSSVHYHRSESLSRTYTIPDVVRYQMKKRGGRRGGRTPCLRDAGKLCRMLCDGGETGRERFIPPRMAVCIKATDVPTSEAYLLLHSPRAARPEDPQT